MLLASPVILNFTLHDVVLFVRNCISSHGRYSWSWNTFAPKIYYSIFISTSQTLWRKTSRGPVVCHTWFQHGDKANELWCSSHLFRSRSHHSLVNTYTRGLPRRQCTSRRYDTADSDSRRYLSAKYIVYVSYSLHNIIFIAYMTLIYGIQYVSLFICRQHDKENGKVKKWFIAKINFCKDHLVVL